MIRFLRLLIGGTLFAIGFVITDKKDLADLVNMIKKNWEGETMTDNIQKLYEIAGIPRIYSEFNNGRETIVENVFSPYRQLELIKFVSNFKVYETVKHKNRKWFMCASIGCDDYYESKSESFDQTLANLILQLWQDLTYDQKQEIKRILQ